MNYDNNSRWLLVLRREMKDYYIYKPRPLSQTGLHKAHGLFSHIIYKRTNT